MNRSRRGNVDGRMRGVRRSRVVGVLVVGALGLGACGDDGAGGTDAGTSPGGDASADAPATGDGGVDASAPPDAPVTGAPAAEDGTLTVEVDSAASGVVSATDPDGDVLTYRIVDAPALGTLTDFDAATGAFMYTAGSEPGADFFTFQVNDGERDAAAPGRVDVMVTPFNYTGWWVVAPVSGYLGCPEQMGFQVDHYDDRLVVQGRYVTCSYRSGTTTLSWGPFGPAVDVRIRDADLLLGDEVVGTITPTRLEVTVDQSVSGCSSTARATLTLERVDDGSWSYRDAASGCGGGGVSGPVALTPNARVLTPRPAAGLGAVELGTPVAFDIELRNIGKREATALALDALTGDDVSFAGGSFPGDASDCTDRLPAGERCTLKLTITPAVADRHALAVDVAYDDETDLTGLEVVAQRWLHAHPPLTDPVEVVLGNQMACVLDTAGVHCWGATTESWTIPTLTNPTHIDSGGHYACALDDTGVVCWPAGSVYTTVPALGAPTTVATGASHACAIDGSDVTCWGESRYSITGTRTLDTPTAIDLGSSHVCALDVSGFGCWGYYYGTIPATLVDPIAIAAGDFFTCVVDAGDAVCFANYASHPALRVPALSNVTAIAAGNHAACAVDDTGTHCWGDIGGEVPADVLTPTSLAVGYGEACAIVDRTLRCW